MHVHPWFEPIPISNISITWGARTHTSRNGGSLVSGPPNIHRRLSGASGGTTTSLLTRPRAGSSASMCHGSSRGSVHRFLIERLLHAHPHHDSIAFETAPPRVFNRPWRYSALHSWNICRSERSRGTLRVCCPWAYCK